MDATKKRKLIVSILGIVGVLSITLGVTVAFFNYTRTGNANTISVGRIAFNSTQDGRINLTNIFPIDSEDIDNALEEGNNVTININGDTTYQYGIEYLVTAEDVNITVNNKKVPLNLYITSTTDLGNNDPDYFDNRGGNMSMHKVLSGGVVVDGQYLVVGYIAPGQEGIEGNLNIKAYIDKDKIAITDTPEENIEWQRGRTIFTTEEWNSIQQEGHELSFKIRVEANEGVWVDPYTTPNLMNNININKSAVNIKEIRFIEETPLRMQRRYDASVGEESNGTKADLTYQDTGKVLAWIEPMEVTPTGTSNELLNIKPKFLVNEDTSNNLKQIDNEPAYILYIASSGKTKWVTGNSLFKEFTSVEKIIFENVDSSSVTSMYDMFNNCNKLRSIIGLNTLDTSNVTDMQYMFSGCSSLTSIDLSGLGSNNLNAIGYMFYNCNALTEIIMKNFNFGQVNFYNNSNYYYAFAYLPNVETIDLTNANTSGVTSMYDMFYSCTKLKNIIGLNTLDISNVTDMRYMFAYSEIESINLSGMNMSSVTTVYDMFYSCKSLALVKINNANLQNVTDMQYMFSDCDALVSIDLNNLNINSVQTMNSMFSGCDNLESVIFTGIETTTLRDMSNMFSGCTKLINVNLSGLGGNNLYSVGYMFYNCTSLKNINMSNFNFGGINSFDGSSSIFYPLKGVLESINLSGANFSGPNISSSSFYAMFQYFSKLKTVDLSNANTSKVTSMQDLFGHCPLLENVNLAGIDTSNVTNMQYMFDNCDSITKLDLKHLNTSKVTNMYYMFRYMDNLEEIDISGWGNNSLSNTYGMFASDIKLKTIIMNNFNFGTSAYGAFYSASGVEEVYLSNAITNKVTDMSLMFDGCRNLKTIYVSNTWDTTKVTDSGSMFSNCTSLVGGAGTTFNASYIDKTRAIIDGGTSNPGYLTLKTN